MSDRRHMRRLAIIAAIVLAATALTSCGGPSTTVLERGHQGPASEIPWSSVSAGWSLALWSPLANIETTKAEHTPVTLYVVDPQGGRYRVGRYNDLSSIQDWSWSGRRALLGVWPNGTERLETVDLSNGKMLDTWRLGRATVGQAFFADPDGARLDVAYASTDSATFHLQQRSLSGRLLFEYPEHVGTAGAVTGSFAVRPGGTGVAAVTAQNGRDGIAFFSATGSVLGQYRLGAYENCGVSRWWSDTSVLANCTPSATAAQKRHHVIPSPLLLVISSSGAVSQLTGEPPGNGDEGDADAWRLASGLYLQEVGYCGEFIVRYAPPNTRTTVVVPGASDNEAGVLGATRTDLGLITDLGCGPGESLAWFDPASRTLRVVLGRPLNGGSVTSAVVDLRRG